MSGRAATRLDVGWTVASGSGAQPAQAQLLGEGNCPPQARVPVELDVRTLDGLLNETVLGQATLMADRSGYVIAEQPVAELTGTLDAFAELGLENDGADASLVWRINVSEPGSETGALYFRAAVEDETPLANW